MNQISNVQIRQTLDRLHAEASSQTFTLMKNLSKGIFRKLRPEDMKDAYIAISRSQGQLIYDMLLKRKAQYIVEFGTSFGISTIYLAAAAQELGGKIITTELLPEKCAVAQQNFREAGVDQVVDLRVGDALETLKDTEPGIDFLLMDGWNDLYLPLLKILEPKFKPGTLIYTDNASFASAKPFLTYLHQHPERYRSKRLQDDKGGSEVTEVIASF